MHLPIPNGTGSMGVHMLNPALLFDGGKIDADQPELLVYEPRNNGTMKLVALEYLVFASDWAGASKPQLFGTEFDTLLPGNRYGLPLVLRAARVDLEAESERDAEAVQPAGRLRLSPASGLRRPTVTQIAHRPRFRRRSCRRGS